MKSAALLVAVAIFLTITLVRAENRPKPARANPFRAAGPLTPHRHR